MDNSQLLVGATTHAHATLKDVGGNPLDDITPAWKSATPAIVSVSAAGEVTALNPGTGEVRASSGAVGGSAFIQVRNPLAATLALARDTATLTIPGGTVQAIAAVTDETGHPIANPIITWTSQQPLIATVTSLGLVSAVASGTARITATIDGLAASLTVSVKPSVATGAPAIASVTPAIMRPGGTFTITGSNFAPSASANTVLLDGVAATVTAATATQLTIAVPSTGFACEATRNASLQVGVNSLAGVATVTFQPGNRQALAVGQSAVVTTSPDIRCNELVPGTGRWVVSVYNAFRSSVSGTLTGNALFMVKGTGSGAVGSATRIAASTPVTPPAASARSAVSAREASHLSLLERNLSALRAAPPATRPAFSAATGASRQIATVGAITPVKIPNLDAADFCVTSIPINARTVFTGAHSIIVEDTISVFNGKATLKGQMDDYFTRLGNEFESTMWPILATNFGNPLAMDAQLNNLGKVVMVFSPRINTLQRSTVIGFVANCDFYPASQRPSSNGGAFFYAIVPTGTGTGYATNDTRDFWIRVMRPTVIHEVKHVTAYAERLSRGLPLEEPSWEEGAARIAEELYARTFYGTTAGANTSYALSVGCDIRFATPTPPCADRPLLILRHFDGLYNYLLGPELNSPLGRAFDNSFNFYAGAWSVLRWASDNYATGESQFFRDFTASTATGVQNLEARTGRSWEEILGEWTLSLYVDDVAGFVPANGRIQMKSWNYPDMWLGMCIDMGPCADASNPIQLYTRPNPLPPRQRTFGDFSVGVGSMVGGGFTILDLQGPGFASQVLEVKALTSAGDAPAAIKIAIVRVR